MLKQLFEGIYGSLLLALLNNFNHWTQRQPKNEASSILSYSLFFVTGMQLWSLRFLNPINGNNNTCNERAKIWHPRWNIFQNEIAKEQKRLQTKRKKAKTNFLFHCNQLKFLKCYCSTPLIRLCLQINRTLLLHFDVNFTFVNSLGKFYKSQRKPLIR